VLLIIVFSSASFTLNASAINKAFEADTLIIESEETDIRIDSKEIFNGEYGVMMNKECIIKNIQIMQKEEYANLKFYKGEKLVIVLKIYEVGEKSAYSRIFFDKHIEVKWNGYQIKLSNEFYKNIKPYLVNSVYLYSF
jgi:mevalonate kinase